MKVIGRVVTPCIWDSVVITMLAYLTGLVLGGMWVWNRLVP